MSVKITNDLYSNTGARITGNSFTTLPDGKSVVSIAVPKDYPPHAWGGEGMCLLYQEGDVAVYAKIIDIGLSVQWPAIDLKPAARDAIEAATIERCAEIRKDL